MNGSLWAWIWQRISAVILVFLVGFHFGIMHFVDPTIKIEFVSTSLRMQGMLYFVTDAAMLALGLFHGLNGIRAIIVDYWPGYGRAAGWILGLLGLVATGYGSAALLVFLQI